MSLILMPRMCVLLAEHQVAAHHRCQSAPSPMPSVSITGLTSELYVAILICRR